MDKARSERDEAAKALLRAEAAVNAGGGGLSEKEREEFYASLESIVGRLDAYYKELK